MGQNMGLLNGNLKNYNKFGLGSLLNGNGHSHNGFEKVSTEDSDGASNSEESDVDEFTVTSKA